MPDPAKRPGTTSSRPSSGVPAPRTPHERDESADSQSSGPREDMQQAHWDITHGLVDTDLHGERGVEEVVKANQPPDPDPGQKLRPVPPVPARKR